MLRESKVKGRGRACPCPRRATATSHILRLIFIAYCLLPVSVYAARPLATEDAVVAGKGITQFEAALDYTKIKDVGEGTSLLLSPIHGVTEETEFSLRVPYILGRPESPSKVEGWGDVSFIMKHMLVEENKNIPAALLRMTIKLPTGDEEKDLGTGDTNIGFLGAITKNIGSSTIHLNLGYTFVGDQKDEPNDKNELNYGIAGEYGVGKKTRVVGEIYRLYDIDYKAEETKRRALIGLTYRLDDTFTMDIAAKRGLEDASDEYGLIMGMTVTF